MFSSIRHSLALLRAGRTLAAYDALMMPEQIRQLPWAARLGLSPDAMNRLLVAAESLRLVRRRADGAWALGELGAAMIGNPGIAAMVEHHAMLYADLADPVELLRRERGGTALAQMKRGAMLVNTSRGGVIDTRAVIRALKTGHLGSLGLDVYEEEGDLFFRDLSGEVLRDDVFARLLTFPNVVITGHQGFFTEEALAAIAQTTIDNLDAFVAEGRPRHPVSVERVV